MAFVIVNATVSSVVSLIVTLSAGASSSAVTAEAFTPENDFASAVSMYTLVLVEPFAG